MIVLDASAILAYLFQEPGHIVVEQALDGCVVSSVNFAEMLSRLARDGLPPDIALEAVEGSDVDIVAFDRAQAMAVAAIAPVTRPLGLSLADRACLALASIRGLPVLTADRVWRDVDVGVEVRLIRP